MASPPVRPPQHCTRSSPAPSSRAAPSSPMHGRATTGWRVSATPANPAAGAPPAPAVRRDGRQDSRRGSDTRPAAAGTHKGAICAPRLGARRAPAAFLWPLRATSAPTRTHPPRPTARTTRRNVSDGARCCKRGHPSGARILKPCVLAVTIARCARVAARSLRASGPLRRRDSGAPVGGMARSERCPWPVAAICSNRPGLSRLITGHGSKNVHVTHHISHINYTFQAAGRGFESCQAHCQAHQPNIQVNPPAALLAMIT